MSEIKKITIEDITTFDDFSKWVESIQWESKEYLYNKGNQEYVYKLLSNSLEKLKLEKDCIYEVLKYIVSQSTVETKYIVYFLLSMASMYKSSLTLRKFLIDYTYEFLDNFTVDKLKESNISTFENEMYYIIQNIDLMLLVKDNGISQHDSCLMNYAIIKNFINSINRTYKDKTTILLERNLVEYYCKKNNESSDYKYDKYLLSDLMGQSIKDDTFSKNLVKYLYLYDGLSEKIKELKEININLINDKNDLVNRIDHLKIKNADLETIIIEKDKIIQAIKYELSQEKQDKNAAENRLGFEKNKYEQGYNTLKSSLLDSLKSSLELEIEGIEDIIEFIPEEKKNKILKRLKRINKIIDEKLGE